MDKDFQGYNQYANGYDPNFEAHNNDMYKDPMISPIMQYEQAYMYYRYLTQQLEYKIKCKEYDKLCGNKTDRRIE